MEYENDVKEITIVGGGIIGVCVAYYLVNHPSFDKTKYHITVFESNSVACAASGKAGGLLASFAFPSQLGSLSFAMHKELAAKYDGEKNWDYRGLETISMEADVSSERLEKMEESKRRKAKGQGKPRKSKQPTGTAYGTGVVTGGPTAKMSLKGMLGADPSENSVNSPNHADSDNESDGMEYNSDGEESIYSTVDMSDTEADRDAVVALPKNLNWIEEELVDDWSTLGTLETTAQLHPYKFTNFILQKAMESGAVDLIYGRVSEVRLNEETGEAVGFRYVPNMNKNEGKKLPGTKIGKVSEVVTPATATKYSFSDKDGDVYEVLNVDRIVIALGPWTSLVLSTCPVTALRAHSMTVQPESSEEITAYAIFTELRINDSDYFSPEIYARKDEVYLCGEGDSVAYLPDPTIPIPYDKAKCEELFNYAKKLSKNLNNGYIKKMQACYLPVVNAATTSGPLVGETNVPHLFIASGHSCWGINNAPITGKLLAEIMLEGEARSAQIDKLNPTLYFDARQSIKS